jgi:3-oxoacyl-[acyl-carrier protein] reductase
MKRFEGKTVFVTGASRGLGAAMAHAFATEGASVWIGYRAREFEAKETASSIEKIGGKAQCVGFDLRRPEEIEKAFDTVLHDGGTLDVLVNNAAVSRDQPFALMDESAWVDVIDTDLNGTARCCRAAVRAMWRARKGAIVNVASVAGPMASPGQANYAASKGGILALTRTLGAELARNGIRINAVVPGLIDAGMTTKLDARILDEKRKRIPAGRLGQAEEVARAVLFLASDEASYIMGQALFVDGGLTL